MYSRTQTTTAPTRHQQKAEGVIERDLKLYRMPTVMQLTGLALPCTRRNRWTFFLRPFTVAYGETTPD